MLKKVLFLGVILFTYLNIHAQEKRLKDILEDVTREPATTAILYVENTTGEREDYLSKRFEEILINRIKKDTNIELVDKKIVTERIKKLGLEELYEILLLLNKDSILKLGKVINIDRLIIASIERYSEDFEKYSSKVYIEGSLRIFDIKKWEEKSFYSHAQTEIKGKRKYYEAINGAITQLVESLYAQSQGKQDEKEIVVEKCIVNIRSKLIHSATCNHLPKEEYRKVFNSLKEATAAGYKPCVICFPAFYPSTEKGEEIEIILARYISGIIEHYYRIKHDKEKLELINKIANKIVSVTPRQNLRYVFNILDTDQVNAFSAGAGYIYVTKGLLDIIEEEDELAGVLAHEIAHSVRKHLVSQYRRSVKLSILGWVLTGGQASLLADFAAYLISSGYSRKYENEADNIAVKYMIEAGYDPQYFILFFKKLHELYKSEPSKLEVYFHTHPPVKERINRIEGFLQKKEKVLKKLDEIYYKVEVKK